MNRKLITSLLAAAILSSCGPAEEGELVDSESELMIYRGSVATLRAHYPFDGNADDVSAYNKDGLMVYGVSPASDRHSVANGALDFDGINDFVWLPDEAHFDMTSFTIAMFVRPEDLPNKIRLPGGISSTGEFVLVSKGSGGNANYQLSLFTRGGASYMYPRFSFRGTDGVSHGAVVWGSKIYRNQWVHLAVTRGSSGYKIYVNGQAVLSSSDTATPAVNGDIPLVGRAMSMTAQRQYLDGRLDDLRYYNYALSASQIANLSAQ